MLLGVSVLAALGLAGACKRDSDPPRADPPAAQRPVPAPTDEEVLAAPVRPLREAPCGTPDVCAAACERGAGPACTQLAVMHLFGIPYVPPSRSPETAATLLDRACELGHVEGCATAAMHFSGMLGGPRDQARSDAYFQAAQTKGLAACRAGDGLACWEIAPQPTGMSESPMQVGEPEIELWRRACAAGVADACGAFAFHLSTTAPELAARLDARALALDEAACAQGDASACLTAALRLQDAGQVERAAPLWQQRLAILSRECEAKIAGSCHQVSQIYDPGQSELGFAKDVAAAAAWAMRACALQATIDCSAGHCLRAAELGAKCPP